MDALAYLELLVILDLAALALAVFWVWQGNTDEQAELRGRNRAAGITKEKDA